MPGDIYKYLMDNKQIPDPLYRDNEEYFQWIGESSWKYEREFKVSASVLKMDRVVQNLVDTYR